MAGWLAAAVSLVALLLGCGEFEAQYRYLGERRLSEHPMSVKTIFWPRDQAVAFATHRDPGEKRARMHLVPVSGAPSCVTGPLTRFAAVADDRGFRLALVDAEEDRLHFYDADCQRVEPVLEGVAEMSLRTSDGAHRFLVVTTDRRLLAADPYAGSTVELAKGVEQFGSGLLRLRNRDALWVIAEGELVAVDFAGERVSVPIPAVKAFSHHTRGGLGDGEPRMLVAVQQQDNVSLLERGLGLEEGDAGEAEPDAGRIWVQRDACKPQIDVTSLSDPRSWSCPDGKCPKDLAALQEQLDGASESSLAGMPTAWVSMYSPCDERRLLLRPEHDEETIVVADRVEEYRVLGLALQGRPTLVFRTAEGTDKRDYFAVAGMAPIPIDVPINMDTVSLTGIDLENGSPMLRFVTQDEEPEERHLGTWSERQGFETLLHGIRSISGSGLVLHDYDGVAGTLSMCQLDDCRQIATGVPDGSFHTYQALERVNEGHPLMAYLHGFDRDTGTGRLSVRDRVTGQVAAIADDVRSYAPVELGPARGVVYSVPDGPKKGLWYAAR